MKKCMSVVIIVILFLSGNSAYGITYYSSGIDFWKDNDQKSDDNSPKEKESQSDARFWKKQSDPRNDDFFKEGNYLPPKPFLRVIRNPSDQNIREWKSFNEKRSKLFGMLVQRMTEYEKKHDSTLSTEEKEVFRKKIKAVPTLDPNRDRFVFRYYFDSRCPHCKKMFDTIRALQQAGYYVDSRRVDSSNINLSSIPVRFQQATAEELKDHKINSVPVLLVADTKRQRQFRINGYQTHSKVIEVLRSQ